MILEQKLSVTSEIISVFTKTHILSIILSIFLLSCERTVDDNCLHITINNKNLADEKDISSVTNSIHIIPLSEEKGYYIAEQYKLYINNSDIIIFDRFQARKVNLYDSNGIFKKNILKVGENDDEAFQINDCWLNSNGLLEAYDFAAKKIYQFDSSYKLKNIINGDRNILFKKVLRNPTKEDSYLAYTDFDQFNHLYDGRSYHIGLLDSKLKLKKASFFYDNKYRGIEYLSFKNNFAYDKKCIIFFQPYDNFLYSIDSNLNVKKYLELIYTQNPLPAYSEVMKTIIAPNISILKKDDANAFNSQFQIFSNYSYFDGLWLESNKYLYILSREKNTRPFVTLLDKTNKAPEYSYTSRSLKVSGKYDFYLPTFDYIDTKTNTLYSVLSGSLIYEFQKPNSKSEFLTKHVTNSPSSLYLIKCKLK